MLLFIPQSGRLSQCKKKKTIILITTTAPLVATLTMQYIFLHYAWLHSDTFWNATTHKWLCVFQSICYQVFVLSKSKAVGTLKCEKKKIQWCHCISNYTVFPTKTDLKFIAVLCNSSVLMHNERNAVWLQCNWREDMKCYHFPDIVVRCVGRWYFGFSLHGLKAVCERQMIQIMAAYFSFYSPCEWHILITKAAPCLALDP